MDIGGITCAVFSTLALAYWLRTGSGKKYKHIPNLTFHVNKAKNVDYVRQKLATGELPDVYQDALTGVIIISEFVHFAPITLFAPITTADFDLLQKVFQCEHASSRLDHRRSALEESSGLPTQFYLLYILLES